MFNKEEYSGRVIRKKISEEKDWEELVPEACLKIIKKIDGVNRIKKLKDSNIIKGFKVKIDWPKIGYYMYKLDIDLKQSKGFKKIIKYVEANPNLNWFCKSIGYVDLEFGFFLNNSHQLHLIMEDLSKKFPDTIKSYTYFCSIKTHKIYKY